MRRVTNTRAHARTIRQMPKIIPCVGQQPSQYPLLRLGIARHNEQIAIGAQNKIASKEMRDIGHYSPFVTVVTEPAGAVVVGTPVLPPPLPLLCT
jgi:hypothetical protein